jgi:four helix bundle protein
VGTGVRDYSQLDVWQICDEVRSAVRSLLRRPCFDRDPDLADQLRRASERPCPVIAEGFSRYHPRDNAKFVRIAKASLSEIIEHLNRAVYQQFITPAEASVVDRLCRRGRGAATGYIRYLEHAAAPGVPRSRPRPPRRRFSSER